MKYTHSEIQKMLEPLFDFMETEHPNNCKLIIEPFSAQLVYEHQEQIWLNKKLNDKFGLLSKDIENSATAKKIKKTLFPNSEITEEDIDRCRTLPDWAKDCCCDTEAVEQQLKDLKDLSYEDYMKKWDTAGRVQNINDFYSSICQSDSSQSKNLNTTTAFNGKE